MNEAEKQIDIKSMTHPQLVAWFEGVGQPPFRAKQVLQWIWQKQADSIEEMTNLSKDLRRRLASEFVNRRLEVKEKAVSEDGSVKFAFGLADGRVIETVLLPERNHYTLCVSSQVGCAMGCKFCRTASLGLARNLEFWEIASQVRDVAHSLDEPEKLTNLVFMGMGEPLANFEQVALALELLIGSDWGPQFAGKKITVSTCGLADKIPELGKRTKASLAISLNAADDETRSRIMPVNEKFPIGRLMEVLKKHPLQSGRQITIEYVLLAGVNDSDDQARKLVRLLAPLRAKVNLIVYNPHDHSPFEKPDMERVYAFQDILLRKKITTVIRASKGTDIAAACGQLGAAGPR